MALGPGHGFVTDGAESDVSHAVHGVHPVVDARNVALAVTNTK